MNPQTYTILPDEVRQDIKQEKAARFQEQKERIRTRRIDDYFNKIIEITGHSADDVKNPSKSRRYAEARAEVCYLLRGLSDSIRANPFEFSVTRGRGRGRLHEYLFTLYEIAELVGKTHSDVFISIKRLEERRHIYKKLNQTLKNYIRQILEYHTGQCNS